MAVKRLTQRDIAQLAGVSQATVSLVLNGSSHSQDRIPDTTRQKVWKIIRETGYVADPVARRMAHSRNSILGVFTYEPAFPSEQADFFAPFLFGIEQEAQSQGYDLLLLTAAAPGADGSKKIFDERNRLRLADGCLVLGRNFDRDELARLVSDGHPFVAVGRRDDAGGPVPYVGADYVAATSDLVAFARANGHDRLAYVGPHQGAESTFDRWRGFQAAMGDARLVHHTKTVGRDPGHLLAEIRRDGATAVFFTELADAIPFRRTALAEGLRVPGDLSLIVLGSHVRPADHGTQFATYAIPREEMGRRATRMLVDELEGREGERQILLTCQRIEGETLGSIQ
ncbi:LacI family DNA-binding transcriptional regulator [Consotaella salsifontis]|uniref:Transcriptional regulator, LacI family n=1 Tax=Consotaella salsifontis TaxID=1365950 RepID=A0A1T4RMY8_9HYPH|nr:LacI family DNA-binding transcriptional regulator [Consotaella salsifontis]SKA17041.1 transcriptional regulator, LacI family [Consotaella salsifontis]